MRRLAALSDDWARAANSTFIDTDAISRAFARHMRHLKLPQQDCIFHPSPQEALPALREYIDDEYGDPCGNAWWKEANYSQDKDWDSVSQSVLRRLQETTWFHVIVGAQQEFELLCKGVYPAWWAATSDAIWAYRLLLHGWLYRNPWSVLREAFAAGTFIFWVHYGIHVVLRPDAWVDPERRLHRDDGPAVSWQDGTGLYFWRGCEVPRVCLSSP